MGSFSPELRKLRAKRIVFDSLLREEFQRERHDDLVSRLDFDSALRRAKDATLTHSTRHFNFKPAARHSNRNHLPRFTGRRLWQMEKWTMKHDVEALAEQEDRFHGDDDTILPHHYDSDDLDQTRHLSSSNPHPEGASRRSVKSSLWVVLMVTSTLAGRSVLRSGFLYPFYFVLLLQSGAYISVAVAVILVKLRSIKRPSTWHAAEKDDRPQRSTGGVLLIGFRTLLSSSVAGVAMLCTANSLLKYSSLPVLVMLPTLTYVADSILFRLAYIMCLIPRDQSFSFWNFWRPIVVVGCLALAINEDYRLDLQALAFAVSGIGLLSLSKVVARIGPRTEVKGANSWSTNMYTYLLAGIPPIVIAYYATNKYENTVAAAHAFHSWGLIDRMMNLGPGIILHVLYSSSMNSAYPFTSDEHVAGALEERSDAGKDALASTLQAGFWIIVFASLAAERTLVNWVQVISFTVMYIVSIGPKQIGYYPPRFLNIIVRLFRRRPLSTHSEPWQFTLFLILTTAMFAVLISTVSMYWINTFAYNADLTHWLEPQKLTLDTLFRPPSMRSLDVVIAHSAGDPISSITDAISTFVQHRSIANAVLTTKVWIYTKDPSFNTSVSNSPIQSSWHGDMSIQTLGNIGGVPGTFLHHILYAWAFLPAQTIFLSTSSITEENKVLFDARLADFYIAPGFPIPDSLPKTGFLNLGDWETCACGHCTDSSGWEDSFHLIPSMFSAVHPGSPGCTSNPTLSASPILLTRGNNFIASAARIRGIKKDIWELLYEALTNVDQKNSWAHNKEKLPKTLEGETKMSVGRWAQGGIYSVHDSLADPWLGYTVERLWGVLLQCGGAEKAWRCASLERGWREGGSKEDCACVD